MDLIVWYIFVSKLYFVFMFASYWTLNYSILPTRPRAKQTLEGKVVRHSLKLGTTDQTYLI